MQTTEVADFVTNWSHRLGSEVWRIRLQLLLPFVGLLTMVFRYSNLFRTSTTFLYPRTGTVSGYSPTLIQADGALNVPNFGTHHKRNRMTAIALVHFATE